jgi:heterodisulfide reductase subunit A-like polyferredoxin
MSIEDDMAVINDIVCRACGRCANYCPEDAIEISIEASDYIDKTIEHLAKLNYR